MNGKAVCALGAVALFAALGGGARANVQHCGCSEGGSVPENSQPDWSPDGQRVAFVHRVGDLNDIYVMNRDGSRKRRLTTTPEREYDPDWSPDGGRIAFGSNR